MALQSRTQLERLEVREEVRMLLEVRLKIDIVGGSSSAKFAHIRCTLDIRGHLLRLALQLLLELQIGNFDSEVGLNLHLTDNLDALADLEIQEPSGLRLLLLLLHELLLMVEGR